MPIKVLMPALSPTMTEGKLAKWHVKEGDEVNSGDVIAEIETDKATMEVEAVDEGIVGKIIVSEGTDQVPVNDVIALLLEEDEDTSALDNVDVSGGAPAPKKERPKQETSKSEEKKEEPKKADSSSQASQAPTTQSGERVFASPLARRMASQNGLDLSLISGSGPRGRVVKADIEKAMQNGTGKAGSAQKPTSGGASMPKGVDSRAQADALGQAYEFEAANKVRQVIANRLQESKQTVPHFYLTVDCEIDNLLNLRKQVNEDATDYKVSVNDFVIRACAKALREVPAANTSWAGDGILHYTDVDVSVAVASENGLITPIIKNADEKSLASISNEMKDLAGRAREGKLKPHEFQGGGFTVSNLGMFGIKSFSAIINPPQSCILAVGAGEQRAVIKDGQVKVATVMTVTLSVDHRSVDGAVGAEFLASFKKLIENPAKILV